MIAVQRAPVNRESRDESSGRDRGIGRRVKISGVQLPEKEGRQARRGEGGGRGRGPLTSAPA